MSKVCHAGAIPAFIIALVLAIPAYLGSGSVSFTYGEGSNLAPDNQVNLDSNTINSSLGESQTWAIMVPEGHWAEEQELVDELKALLTTKSVLFLVDHRRQCPADRSGRRVAGEPAPFGRLFEDRPHLEDP